MATVAFPEPPPSMPATPLAALDEAVERLRSKKDAFATMSIDKRIDYLTRIHATLPALAAEWAELGARAKGLWPGSNAAGEEMLVGPLVTLRNVRLLEEALHQVQTQGYPTISSKAVSRRPDGRTVVQVFPHGIWDQMVYLGYRAEVWMDDGVTPENLHEHQAGTYRHPETVGKVALILGAGNQSSIAPMDALYKLFVEKQVVILKMNPVNEYLGPIMRKLFQCLVDDGFLEVVYGGAEVGSHLCQHPHVDTIHITGSDQTHDAIVWGPPAGRDGRKKRGEKVLTKEITSELGNVTPVIVLPGNWTAKEIAFHAENIAAMVTNNASFNCIAGKLVVTAKSWPQRQVFLDAIRQALAKAAPRKAYYPGARDRWQQFVNAYPHAEKIGEDLPETVPWTFIPNHDAGDADSLAFKKEPFCGLLHEVALEGHDTPTFLEKAVEFCNQRVWGTLAVSLLVHPDTHRDAASEAAYQKALTDLRYGSICVNHWPGLMYGIVTTTWGAHPGHPLEDIQSGRGVVHNTYLFDKPLKSVLYGSFSPMLRPPWFHTHQGVGAMGPKLIAFENQPSLLRLLPILPHAIR